MPGTRRRHVGRPTRGKTAPERLRRTDVLSALLGAPPSHAALMVDVGFGAAPTTTLESYARLGRRRTDLRVIGVEIDRARVAAAAPLAVDGAVEFRLGGFDLPLTADEPPGLVRAMNVLRQYPEAEHAGAMALMSGHLADGGLLLEGTSTPSGRLFTANLVRRAGNETVFVGVVLSANLRRAWEPREMQTVLPKNLIHRGEPGGAIDAAFGVWDRAIAEARRERLAPAAVFARAAHVAAPAFGGADLRPALLARGFFVTRLR
ncbi:MAG TPA: hypothetical protein VGO03_12915 [Acidimicrobiia bacterium]